ncbi:MAG TPA: hypothetical protein VJT54_06230 [Verrucomicrobiae bacterium]|nr:hypothetical protein [Verrucomicrobiae bacterium]
MTHKPRHRCCPARGVDGHPAVPSYKMPLVGTLRCGVPGGKAAGHIAGLRPLGALTAQRAVPTYKMPLVGTPRCGVPGGKAAGHIAGLRPLGARTGIPTSNVGTKRTVPTRNNSGMYRCFCD